MYEAIDDRIEVLVKETHYPCKYVLLVGAIFINGDKDMGSFCQYKSLIASILKQANAKV